METTDKTLSDFLDTNYQPTAYQQYKNAFFYLEQGDTQNIYKAIELLTLAAEKGNAEAQCRLGRLYAEGEFVAEDLKKALYWLKEAAEQGYTEAEDKLSTYLIGLIRRDHRSRIIGRDYRNRFTISDEKPFLDENEILSWLEKTTLTNNPKIQYSIGKLYFLKFDFEEEEEWLTKSAEQDYEEAIIELIKIYDDKYEKYNCNLENLCYWVRKAFSLGIDLKRKHIALNKTAIFLLEKEIDPDSFFDSSIDYTAIKTIRDNSPLTINFIKQWLSDNGGYYYDEEDFAIDTLMTFITDAYYDESVDSTSLTDTKKVQQIYYTFYQSNDDEEEQKSTINNLSKLFKKCIYHKTIFQQLSIDFDHLKGIEEVQQWCVTTQQRYPDIFKVMKTLQTQKMLHTSTPYYELDLSPLESLKIYFDNEDFKDFFEFYNKISTFFCEPSFFQITKEIELPKPVLLLPNEALKQYQLALSYLEEGVKQNIDKAIKLLINAAENRSIKAQRELGKLYTDGQYMPQNREKAIYWLEKAAKRGDKKALDFLINIDFIDKKIISYLEKEAQSGNVEAMLFLGEKFYNESIYPEGLYWLIQAANLENHRAIVLLLVDAYNAQGRRYSLYPCETANEGREFYWLKRALFLGIDLKEYSRFISLKNKILLKRQKAIGADKIYELKDEKAISELIKRSFLDRCFLQQWLREYSYDNTYLYDGMFIEIYDTLKLFMSYHLTIYQELLKEFEIIKNDKTSLQKYFERIEKHYKDIFAIGNKMLSLNMLFVPYPCYKTPLSGDESINIYFEAEDFKDLFEFYNKVFYHYNTYVYELQNCNSEDGIPF